MLILSNIRNLNINKLSKTSTNIILFTITKLNKQNTIILVKEEDIIVDQFPINLGKWYQYKVCEHQNPEKW